MLKRAILAIVCVCIVMLLTNGCDYKVALVDTPALPIEPKLIGLWETLINTAPVKITILELDAKQYLVVYPSDSPDAMYARATFCAATDFALVQLTWIGAANAQADFSKAPHQYAAFKLDGDELEVRLLNPATVKPTESAAELLADIKANNANPALFRDTITLSRVKPPTDRKQNIIRPPIPVGWR